MKKSHYIITLTDWIGRQSWVYGSVLAMCSHAENPLDATPRTIQLHVKNGGGYPITLQGLDIDRVKVISMSDIGDDNPATVDADDTTFGTRKHVDY